VTDTAPSPAQGTVPNVSVESADEQQVWNDATVGGWAPYPHKMPICGVSSPEESYGCNRQRGHAGQHVACTMATVLETWR
jgi:hypothetical protein